MSADHDPVIEMVMIDADEGYRPVGHVSREELEELERMHDSGDIRAESRLKLLREGRPTRSVEVYRTSPAPRTARWDDAGTDPAEDIARAQGCTVEQAWEQLRRRPALLPKS